MPRTINALSLCWEYPPFISGGLGVACWGLNTAIEKRGLLNISVVTPRCLSKTASVQIVGAYDGHYRGAVQQAGEFKAQCLREICSKNIDVIHAHDWMTFDAALALRELLDVPVVAHFHSTEVDRSGAVGSEAILTIEGRAYRDADAVVTVSQYAADVLDGLFSKSCRSRAVVIHNGISGSPEIGRPLIDRTRRVIFVGRLTEQKGIAFLLASIADVLDRDPDALVSIIGGGHLQDQVAQIIEQNGWYPRVIAEGILGRASIDARLSDARVLVMPSSSEPFGLVALEAIMQGVPVIASTRSGVIEANPNIRTIATKSVVEWTNTIVEFLRATDAAEAQRKAAARNVAYSTWDRAGAMAEMVLIDAAARRPLKPLVSVKDHACDASY